MVTEFVKDQCYMLVCSTTADGVRHAVSCVEQCMEIQLRIDVARFLETEC